MQKINECARTLAHMHMNIYINSRAGIAREKKNDTFDVKSRIFMLFAEIVIAGIYIKPSEASEKICDT